MRFHERLLLFFLPLTIIPLAILAFVFLYFIGQNPSGLIGYGNRLESLIFFFVMVMGIACLWMIRRAATSLSRPLHASVEYLRRLAQGERDFSFQMKDADVEVQELVEGLDQLRVELSGYELKLKQKSADEAVGKITTQVAHDIRSPLSSLQTAVDYLAHLKIDDAKGTDILNLLELSAKRLAGIADGLLKKYRGDAPQNIIFSLYKILDELVGEFKGQEKYKQVVFIKQYHPYAIELYGDPARLQRAFGNIIKNAMEAMKFVGNIALQTQLEKGSAIIAIKDEGPGMAQETLKKVLAGGFTQGKEEGHGIGITVAREVTKQFHGVLWADSELEKGTTFHFQIPLPSANVLKTAEREFQAMKEFILCVTGKEQPIVIIDDEPSMREQWRLQLKDNHLQALLCESFEDFERLEITSQISKTAIVDYHFDNSELTGTDVIQKLQERDFKNLYL